MSHLGLSGLSDAGQHHVHSDSPQGAGN